MKYKFRLIALAIIFFAPVTQSATEVIEEIPSPPKESSSSFTEEEAISRLVSASGDVVYAVKAAMSDESFQAYNDDEKIIIELMLANYKVSNGEPYYFMQEIKCPRADGIEKMKEWAANHKIKYLEKFAARDNESKFICTAILGQNGEVLSWIHSLLIVSDKNKYEVSRKLENLALEGLKLDRKPYFVYKEIVLP